MAPRVSIYLKTKLATGGFRTFYNGGLGAVMANIVGYYPWFATYNTLEEYLPRRIRKVMILPACKN